MGKHPSSISKLADQASPCSASLGVKGGQRLRPVSVTSPPLNLAPSGPPGKARRIPGKEEGGFLPAPILAGGTSALQLTPDPSLRQPLTLPGSDVAPENSDAQVAPAGWQRAHHPPGWCPASFPPALSSVAM